MISAFALVLAAAGAAACQTMPAEELALQEKRYAKPIWSRIGVYDQDRKPAFNAGSTYIAEIAGNPKLRIYELDPEKKWARVSPKRRPGLWLRCRDLSFGSCIGYPEDAPGYGRGPRQGPLERGVPNCPGDPRCPKPKGR